MIDLICWDFGDTLVDERWMRRPHPSYSAWADRYDEVLAEDPGWVSAWERGQASVDELIDRLQDATGLPRASIESHIAGSCEDLRFFDVPRRALEGLRGQVSQACTTVNPDVFSRYVVPAYGLEALFDVVVTSWETGLVDKSALARRARMALGRSESLGTTLLIDNKAANVDEFIEAGGFGYHFKREESFAADYAHGLAGLLAAAARQAGEAVRKGQ
jgi:FMN phosphatase YigB (HAD superfamily)